MQTRLIQNVVKRDIEINKATILHHWLETFIKADSIAEVMEKEFEEATWWFYNIEELTSKNFGEKFAITFEYLLKNFFILLDYSKCNYQNLDLHCLGLKLLRKIIEVRNSRISLPASDWDTEDWI